MHFSALIILFSSLVAKPSRGVEALRAAPEKNKFVCEAMMDGSFTFASDQVLRQFHQSLSGPNSGDIQLNLMKFETLTQIFGREFEPVSPTIYKLGQMKDAQLVSKEPLRDSVVASAIHITYSRSQTQWDIRGKSATGERSQTHRLSLFELRQARILSEEKQTPVVVEAISPNGYSYVAAFRDGAPVATDFDVMNILVPSLIVPTPVAPEPPAVSTPATAVSSRRRRTSAANALEEWQTAVRTQSENTIQLPFKMTKELTLRLLTLPLTIDEYPDVAIDLGFVKVPQSVIPFWKDSGHSPYVIHVDGYQYVLKFRSENVRTKFLKEFWNVSSTLLDRGEVRGERAEDTRYTVVLRPEQFQALTAIFHIDGLPGEDVGQTPTTWSDVRTLDWVQTQTTGSGTRYYFDRSGQAVAVRREGRYFRIESKLAVIARNAASHAEILKRQRGGRGGDVNEAPDLGLGEANRAVDATEAELKQLLAKGENSDLLQKLSEAKIYTSDHPVSKASRMAGWAEVLRYRHQALNRLALANPASLAAQLRFSTPELCRHPTEGRSSEMIYRFGWIPDVALGIGGLILSRSESMLHHQLFALALGRSTLASINPLESLRGGLLRLSYGPTGQLENAVVIAGRMWTQIKDDPRPVLIEMSAMEKQAFGMGFVNWCNERRRGDQTMFIHGTGY